VQLENRDRWGRDQIAAHRAIKILTSQVCFLLGMTHCQKFACTLNWTNNMQELDARPLRACPNCLRKLQDSLGFDVRQRYLALAESYDEMGLSEEAAWVQRRLLAIPEGP
jgi:hypothetical protein